MLPSTSCIIVQGGPGTGQTAIGLHRAAFLLYEHRPTLERHRLLIVGPNRIFLRYISQVLPSLGEAAGPSSIESHHQRQTRGSAPASEE